MGRKPYALEVRSKVTYIRVIPRENVSSCLCDKQLSFLSFLSVRRLLAMSVPEDHNINVYIIDIRTILIHYFFFNGQFTEGLADW